MSWLCIPCRTRCRYSSLGGCFLFLLSILPGFASEAICWSTHHLSHAPKANDCHTTPCRIACSVVIRGFAYRPEATHKSHKLQSCDAAVFAPLKAAYCDAVERLGRDVVNAVGKQQFRFLYSAARNKAFTKKNILTG